MPLRRFQVSAMLDTGLPRDRIVNNVYLNTAVLPGVSGDDPDALADDLAHVFDDIWYAPGRTEIAVSAYRVDQQGPPDAHVVINPGQIAQSAIPRELAICLSFYANLNQPRRRGRIYLSASGAGIASATKDIPVNMVTKALDLATGIANVGGIDVDWSTHSTIDGSHHGVTDAWCDAEWDTVRSRGLASRGRQTRHIGEE